MRIKSHLVIVLSIILTCKNLYSKVVATDSLRGISLALRIAAGINMLQQSEKDRVTYGNNGNMYISNTNGQNGYLGQLGLKLNTPQKRAISFIAEFNYEISKYKLNYSLDETSNSYLTFQPQTYHYDANYSITAHSGQFVLLAKTTIGAKKLVYISFGLFAKKPFYYLKKGTCVQSSSSSSPSFVVYTNDDLKVELNNFNLGAICNFGLDVPIKKKIFSVELRLQPGLTKTVINPNLMNYSVLLSAGYTFRR